MPQPDPWAPFEPAPSAWTLKQAGHLLRYATFGFTHSQLQQAVIDGPQRTVDRLLAPPLDYPDFEQTMAALTPREASPRVAAQLALYRILNTPYPLREKAPDSGKAISVWLFGDTAPAPPAGQDTRELLSTLLRSNLFFSPANYRRRVKTPLEFALNLAIPLGVQLAPAQLQTQLAALGQVTWGTSPGPERRWLNPFTRIGRSNLATGILDKMTSFPDRSTLVDMLLQDDAPPATLRAIAALEGRELAQAIANLPEFQLL